MLNDTELVSRFSQELGEDYRLAKSYVRDVPTQALLHVRSFTHKLTGLLGESRGVSFSAPNLYDRIEQLNGQRLIDVRSTRALHRLRGYGNRGAHPEKYHLTEQQLLALAEKAIRDLLSLVEHLFVRHRGGTAPEYYFEEFDSVAGRDLCYRAVMEDDAEAQYLVGMSLKARALMQREQELALVDRDGQAPADESASGDKSSATLAQAAHWFAQAAPRHGEALHEHGVALLHGYAGDKHLAEGEQAIFDAAQAGVVNAMALLGYFYLVGSHCFGIDESCARKYLQLAAEQEQEEAMANLGVLCYQQGQLSQAHDYIAKAAQAGYLHSQYHLALMLASGEGVAADPVASEYWMAEAAEQGQLDAMLARARHMLNDDNAFDMDQSLAEKYLREVIRYGHSVPAMIELSMALADGILGHIDVVGSAALLRLARSKANEEEAEIIVPLWDSLALQVDKVMAVTGNADELKSLRRARELLSSAGA